MIPANILSPSSERYFIIDLITEDHSGFIKNRCISDNIRTLDSAVKNGLETKIWRTFLDFLHLGHEFFVISGHGA